MEACLHTDVYLIGPLAEMSGKAAVTEAAKNLSHILTNIEIRAKFSSGNYLWYGIRFRNLVMCLLMKKIIKVG